MALDCNIFVRAEDGQLVYRGTVDRDGVQVYAGPWQLSKSQAIADAEKVAKRLTIAERHGRSIRQGRFGPEWRVEKWGRG